MKYILFILLSIILTSCVSESNPTQTSGVVLSQSFSLNDNKYISKFVFFDDTVSWVSYNLYLETKPGDSIEIFYVNRYILSREGTTNLGLKIKKVIKKN